MLFLIDEDVPVAVGEFLRQRGHDVRFVADEFGRGTPVLVIAAGGDLLGAIIVTFNRSHFQQIEEVIDVIEFQYQRIQGRQDKRLIMDISEPV